jgi:hypothetical protein
MALDTQITDAMANAMANAGLTQCNGGTLKIYDGAKPANGDTAITGQVLLSSHALGNPAFGGAAGGVAAANPIADGTAVATGQASWCRFFTSGGAPVFDGTVGVGAGFNLNLNSIDIQVNAKVSINSYSFTVLKAGQ